MNTCIQQAKDEQVKALCLYYSMDCGWESTMYNCKNFCRGENTWISASRSWIDVCKARGFSGIYKKEVESAFLPNNISTGICISLMLKTPLAFKKVTNKYKD